MTTTGQTHRERAPGWLDTPILLVATVATLVALYTTIVQVWIEDLWDDPNYGHVFIVPLISGFVVWQRRRELARLVPHGDLRGALVLLAGVLLLIVGDVAAETFLMRTSLIVVLAGLILLNLGPHVLRVLAFPLLFVLFMVPIPSIFFYATTARLQDFAAQSGALGLDLLGIPVIMDGNIIHLSRITLGVTEACSGIRSLMTLVALGVAWAYLMLSSLWTQLVLVIAVLPITILANSARIVMTGLIGRWFGVDYAEGFFHLFSGWLIFGVALLGLLAVDRILRLVASHACSVSR